MKTIVNIGTDKKNIAGVIFNKPFRDITYKDIKEVVIRELGNLENNSVQGWCNVTDSKK